MSRLMQCAVFFYSFNDIDHISPVVWKLLQRGHRVSAVMLDPDYDTSNDERLQFLKTQTGFDIQPVGGVVSVPGAKWLFRQHGNETRGLVRRALRKALRMSGISVRFAARFLRRNEIELCIFEWGSPGGHNRIDFHTAGKALGIPMVCLPHGLNIYVNEDVNEKLRNALKPGLPVWRGYSDYDSYVFQSELHRNTAVAQGMDPDICNVLGSARYCPEWSRIVRDLYDRFETQEPTHDRLKVVFMLTHWTYNVDREATLAAITEMARCDWIYLVVKDHTRGTGSLPAELRDEFRALPAAEAAADVSSVALISWADAIVCFGSSVGFEALLQDKILINPSYMHGNRTVFEEMGAGLETQSLKETMDLLDRLHRTDGPRTPCADSDRLFNAVVYGGRPPFDILQTYCEHLERIAGQSR